MASITIPLYYDLDLLLWTSAAGGIAPQPNLVLGQSDSIAFAVQFVRSGVVIELTAPQFICGIKPINDTAGDYLCQTTTVVKTGATTTTVYTFTLLLDSIELQAWLLTVTAVTNYAAFSIRDTVNLIATLPAITCTILPDYTLTGATPAAASGTLVVDSGATFTVHKTFAMPVDNGTDTYVLKTNGAGVGRWAVDSAGTGTVTNVAVTTANGVSGTVANPTASAAITIALGAITPTTGAFSSTTDATNSTTAPLKTAGGLAVAKSLYVGQLSYFGDDAEFSGDVRANTFVGRGAGSLAFFDQATNPTFEILSVSDSVNYVSIEPSAAGSPPHIYAKGTDTNIGLHLSPKGTGYVNIQDGNDNSKRLRFGASGNGTGIITTIESSSTTSQTITLPNATGATTLAGLQMVQTFSAAQTFSATVNLSLNTDATSSIAGGTLTVTGGASVSRKLFVGSLLDLVATTATAGQITQAGTRLLHTYGTDNLFLGGGAGNTTNTGFYSVGIGTRALSSLSTGRQNLCFGFQAGYYITTGWDNTIFGGYNTGLGISTGAGNTIIGAGADITNGNYRGAIGAYSSCSADDTIVIGKVAGTYSVNGTSGSRSADNVIIPGLLTANGGVTIASGKALKLGNAAVTGLTPGVLAATTNATLTITDSTGQVYRIPCII
jgi:hypothetical protein